MKSTNDIFHLKVQKIEQTCLFELTWGQSQSLTVQVDYPEILPQLYQEWQRAYLNFYQSDQMRGQVLNCGIAAISVDWHAELVKMETRMMYELHRWLRSAELYELRSRLSAASQAKAKANPEGDQTIQVFLTCSPIELERYPWESWELEGETAGTIAIIRAPLNINHASSSIARLNRRPRILAILGDDTGLNFEADRTAVKSLLRIADVKFVGWQPEQTATQVTQAITSAIADEQGWDLLFFAGHSNETALTGGELGIAPGLSISISEITPQLMAAKQRGLQVAIFNSCSGLNIAQSLIDIGFGQVVVMREPIHNRVAQEFLVHFLQGLGKHHDIYQSLVMARQFMRMEKSHTYPSASLVPSLFCHPGAELFRIPAFGWQQRLRKLCPNPVEAIGITAALACSLLPPVNALLLNGRGLAQATYRNVTQQIPADEAPPVVLVQIDTESIAKSGMTQINPLDRSYLSKIVDRLRESKASVVGVDVLFDSPQATPPNGDLDLGDAVRRAVDAKTWMVFASILETNSEVGVNPATGINSLNWSMQGFTDADPHWVELPNFEEDCRKTCPMSYLLSIVQTARQEIVSLPQPNVDRTKNLRHQMLDAIQQKSPPAGNLPALRNWRSPFDLQPIVDYSLPPSRVYQSIPAWKLLADQKAKALPLLSQQVVLVAAGNDDRLGTAGQGDRFDPPWAMSYWTRQPWLTGGESLAYMTHHYLNRHLVVPIPDAWLIGLAIVVGKVAAVSLRQLRSSRSRSLQIWIGLSVVTLGYTALCLQLYISAMVLLPWLFPSAILFAYVLPTTQRKIHHA
jgi:hypothetical protein